MATVTESFVVTATEDITNSDYRVAGEAGIEAVGTRDVVVHVADLPDVMLSKSAMPAEPGPGEAVTFTLSFSNLSLTPASGVVITDLLPASILHPQVTHSGAMITPQMGSAYVWDVADLGYGEGGIITITGILSSPLPAGLAITNTACITADLDGNPGNNEAQAIVTVADLPPVAEAGAEQWADVGAQVMLDGSGSYDPNGDALSYHWLQTGGSPVVLSDAAVVTPTFTATSAGYFTFTLTVTDTSGLSASDETVVIVAHKLYLPLVVRGSH